MTKPPTPKNDKASLRTGNANNPNSYNTKKIVKATEKTTFQTLTCLLLVLFNAIPNVNKAHTRIKISNVFPKTPEI